MSSPFNDILWCGRVRYIDLEKEHVPSNATPPVGPLKRFFYKHHLFDTEREFRLVLDLGASVGAIGDPRPPDGGVFVTFDFQELVEAIVIGPDLLESNLYQIRSAAASAGLSDRIVESALRGTPRFL